jgi:hypothetical protein
MYATPRAAAAAAVSALLDMLASTPEACVSARVSARGQAVLTCSEWEGWELRIELDGSWYESTVRLADGEELGQNEGEGGIEGWIESQG